MKTAYISVVAQQHVLAGCWCLSVSSVPNCLPDVYITVQALLYVPAQSVTSAHPTMTCSHPNCIICLQDVYISVLAPTPVEAVEAQVRLPQLAAARRGSAPTPVELQFQHPGTNADKPTCLPASNMAQVK